MKTFLSRLWIGIESPVVGLKYIWSGPKLWPLTLVPVVMTSGLMVLGAVWGVNNLAALTASWMPTGVGLTRSILGFLLQGTSVLVYIFSVLLGTFVVTRLLLIPFNAVIAEKVLVFEGVLVKKPERFSVWLRKSVGLLGFALLQTLFFLLVGSLLFVISFVPVLQFFGWFLGLLIVAFDCADYSLEYAELRLKQKLALVRSHLPEFTGLSFVVGLTLLIPIINFLFLPIAVIGASRLVATFPELWSGRKIKA